MLRSLLLVACLLMLVFAANGEETDGAVPPDPAAGAAAAKEDETPKTICALIEGAAEAHEIPVDFLTRLIWKESSFRSAAVSPKGAQGIAQFMPGTAALRQLSDPFDPEEAIPAAASYLRALSARFGNLGLAAAAYNAGEQRVYDWLAGRGGLPWETQDYVLAVTGRVVEEWTHADPNVIGGGVISKRKPTAGCLELAALLAKPGAGSEVVASVPKGPWAPWGVQVAGNFSLNRAFATYSAMQKRYAAILGAQPPMVVRSVIPGRGRAPLFQIRVPAKSRDDANGICQRLHAAGGACIVFRN